MIKLSSSLMLDACANVKPVRFVSAVSGREVATPLMLELSTWPDCVCLIMKLNLNESSSSLFNRRRKEGVNVDCGGSGSYERKVRQHQNYRFKTWPVSQNNTCTYSIGVSSPGVRAATYLDAGKAFGVSCNSVRPWAFRTTMLAMATKQL